MNYRQKTSIWRRLKGLMLKRMHHMITCKEFEEFVLSYLEGELSNQQQSVFEWHLRICRECRDYLAAYQRATELDRAVLPSSKDTLPEEVPEDLIRAILDARKH